MAKRQVELVLSAKNKTDKSFSKVNKNISKLEKHTKRIKAMGNIFSGFIASAAIISSFRSVIDATIEEEAALAQVEQRLKSTGGASEQTLESLKDMAAGMQKITTYGDEATLKMQSLLLTFTNIKGDTFQDATTAILDMSVAMDQDLKTSALQLGKALNDPIKGITALTRVGVAFTEQQKDQIKTLTKSGKVAEAQAIILKELQKEFGGAAKAAADTFGGALKQLNNAFGDLLEADTGGLTGAKKEIQALTDILQDKKTQEAAKAFAGAVVSIATAVTGAIVDIVNFTKAVSDLKKEFEIFDTISDTVNDALIKLVPGGGAIQAYLDFKDAQKETTKTTKELKETAKETKQELGAEVPAGFIKKIPEQVKEAKKEISDLEKVVKDLESNIGGRTGSDENLQTIDLVRKLQDARSSAQDGNSEQAIRDAQEAVRVAEVLRESGDVSQFYLDNMTKQAADIVRSTAEAQSKASSAGIDVIKIKNETIAGLSEVQNYLDNNPLIVRYEADIVTSDIAREALKQGVKE